MDRQVLTSPNQYAPKITTEEIELGAEVGESGFKQSALFPSPLFSVLCNPPLLNPPVPHLTHNSRMAIVTLRTRRLTLQIGLKIKHAEIYPAWQREPLVPALSKSYLMAAHGGKEILVH